VATLNQHNEPVMIRIHRSPNIHRFKIRRAPFRIGRFCFLRHQILIWAGPVFILIQPPWADPELRRATTRKDTQ
jgi:hypothetical protein